jgi:hypothetical protein
VVEQRVAGRRRAESACGPPEHAPQSVRSRPTPCNQQFFNLSYPRRGRRHLPDGVRDRLHRRRRGRPVNAGLALLTPLTERYEAAGLTDVTIRTYPAARHEILNETNRDQIIAELKAWLDRVVAGAQR